MSQSFILNINRMRQVDMEPDFILYTIHYNIIKDHLYSAFPHWVVS